jgi:hypothetical protein
MGQLCAGLADQFTPVDQDQHATTTLDGACSDGAEDDRLAAAGGSNQQRRASA